MNFDLKNKRFLKRSLVSMLVLSGLVGTGYVAGNYVNSNNVSAEILDIGSLDYYRHSANGVTVEDAFGPFTINGKWVWCIEPTRRTINGSNYTSQGDTMTTQYKVRVYDYASQRLIKEIDPDGLQRLVAAVFPYVMLKMPMDEVEALLRERGMDDSENMINVVRSIRTVPDYAKFTTIQLIFWQFTGSGFQSPKNIIASNGANSVAKTNYVNDLLNLRTAGLQASSGPGLNQDWLMHWYHRIIQEIDIVSSHYNWEYKGGSEVWYSSDLQRLVTGFGVLEKDKPGKIEIFKTFSDLTNGVSGKPNFNPEGIRFGIYKDVNATQAVETLTLDANGYAISRDLEHGVYYVFELDDNGNPVKSDALEVVTGNTADRGYVSGRGEGVITPYVTVTVPEGATVRANFVNTPEVVNFTFSKVIAADSVKPLEALDPQYTRVGAVYTLYTDAGATKGQEVTRDGQVVTATIGTDGTAEFSNLYRGTYYVKETAVPTYVDIVGNLVERFELDPKIYTVDLTSVQDNETITSDATVAPTKEYKKIGAFVTKEPIPENQGSLVIKKKDAETKSNKPQGQATLQDALFKVEFYNMTTLGTANPIKKWEVVYKTDANGEIDVRNRNLMVSTTNADAMNKLFTAYEQVKEWGAYDYRVTEIKSPNGYKLGDTPQTEDFVVKDPQNYKQNSFTWSYDDASIYNDDLEIELIKTQSPSSFLFADHAKNIKIKDATFELTNVTSGDKFTARTDDNGKLKFDGVIAGDYKLKEVNVPKYLTNGQVIDIKVAQQEGTTKLVASSNSVETDENGAFNVTETIDKDILVEMEDKPKPATGKLIKANEKGRRLEGAEFKLTRWGKESVILKTNANGEVDFGNLIIGEWYELEEVKAPKGYKLPAKRTTLVFRPESIPAQDGYNITYYTRILDKTNENNQIETFGSPVSLVLANEGEFRKLDREGINREGISFEADEANGTMAIEFDFVNNTWQKLPATGSNFGLIAGVAALVIVIGSTVFYVKRRDV